MSFLKNIFGSNATESNAPAMNWNVLNNVQQLDTIVEASKTKPVLLFKHSTRCIISRTVLKNFEKEFDLQDQVVPYYLDLLEYRPISNAIAERFNVTHQSPQILIIKEGVSVYDISHEGITVDGVRSVLG